MKFKFAHLADCHLGSWSAHPDLREMSVKAFEKALDICAQEAVDFILIAGDLFDTSMPPIDILKRSVSSLKKCIDRGIRIYAVAGSHDYSPTGKTMLLVLEEAGLIKNVGFDGTEMKLVRDETGAEITGVIGRRGSLEKSLFETLDRSIENRGSDFRIFVFHSALDEYKPDFLKNISSISSSLLPKNFDYYAGGHVHHRFSDNDKRIFFPGELFPTEFKELETYDSGFLIASVDNGSFNMEQKSVKLFDSIVICVDGNEKTVNQIENEIAEKMNNENLVGNILLLKLSGVLASGRSSDMDYKKIYEKAKELGALTIKKSDHLRTKEFEEAKIKPTSNIEELEKELIKECAKGKEDTEKRTLELMNVLKEEKHEGETNAAFEERLLMNAKKVLGL